MPQDERNTERHGRKRRPGAVKRRSNNARRRSRRRIEPEREPDIDMIKRFGHKLVSFAVALLLIFLIILIAFGGRIKTVMDSGEKFSFHSILEILYPEKYSYSTQYADMNEYFNQIFPKNCQIQCYFMFTNTIICVCICFVYILYMYIIHMCIYVYIFIYSHSEGFSRRLLTPLTRK